MKRKKNRKKQIRGKLQEDKIIMETKKNGVQAEAHTKEQTSGGHAHSHTHVLETEQLSRTRIRTVTNIQKPC